MLYNIGAMRIIKKNVRYRTLDGALYLKKKAKFMMNGMMLSMK
jgi:hypothetical protein